MKDFIDKLINVFYLISSYEITKWAALKIKDYVMFYLKRKRQFKFFLQIAKEIPDPINNVNGCLRHISRFQTLTSKLEKDDIYYLPLYNLISLVDELAHERLEFERGKSKEIIAKIQQL